MVVSDADVLWRSGWQLALTAVLASFPECGVVGAAPAPNLATYATSATVLEGIARREVSRRALVGSADLDPVRRERGQRPTCSGGTGSASSSWRAGP